MLTYKRGVGWFEAPTAISSDVTGRRFYIEQREPSPGEFGCWDMSEKFSFSAWSEWLTHENVKNLYPHVDDWRVQARQIWCADKVSWATFIPVDINAEWGG